MYTGPTAIEASGSRDSFTFTPEPVEVTLPVGWETGVGVIRAHSETSLDAQQQPAPPLPMHPGEFVAPEGAEPCSSELFVAVSSWLSDLVAFEKSRKDVNERKAAASPRQRTMVGAFVCERSPHPLSPVPNTKKR